MCVALGTEHVVFAESPMKKREAEGYESAMGTVMR